MQWLDRLALGVAPRWTARRIRARAVAEVMARHYEAGMGGRRTSGWTRTSADANAAAGPYLTRLRDVARDLVRNNPYAESAVSTIVDHMVGYGIVPSPLYDRWSAWAESSACDADGRHDLAGLQKLVAGTVVESGECLIRRRWRRVEDGLPIPLQLQVLEPDHLDPLRDNMRAPSGGPIIQGIEFDGIGRRAAYWLLRTHPGAQNVGQAGYGISDRIPAGEVLHVFRANRPGQVRGVSWFAPVILRMKDFDEYEDAALMKQKIAACLAVITSDVDGTSAPLGTEDTEDPMIDRLGPGMIINAPPGRGISVVQPPTIREHGEYAQTVLRAIAAGLGITYEDLCGDYGGMPFSAARMSRLRHWARVDDWRWRMLIPQFCDPVWRWALEAANVVATERLPDMAARVEWTAPPPPMIEPDKEGLAYQRLIRIGAMTWDEMVRERGYDPEKQLATIQEWNAKFDAAEVILDCDPRRMSQQGQPTKTEEEPMAPALSSQNGARHP